MIGSVIIDSINEITRLKNIEYYSGIKDHLHFGIKPLKGARFIEKNIKSFSEYNQFLTSVEFWQQLEFDYVLIWQQDSFLRRFGIEKYLKYDYVGAPWRFYHRGGNGGLSLRKVSSCLDLVKRLPFDPRKHGNEDVYFSKYLNNVAPRDICMDFSCETIYTPNPMGCHAIEKYLSVNQINQLKNDTKYL